jgi:hypothetical protein
MSRAEGTVVTAIDGDGDWLPESVLRRLVNSRIHAISADEPADQLAKFLKGVLAD